MPIFDLSYVRLLKCGNFQVCTGDHKSVAPDFLLSVAHLLNVVRSLKIFTSALLIYEYIVTVGST